MDLQDKSWFKRACLIFKCKTLQLGKGQGMPKYQNMYLGQAKGVMMMQWGGSSSEVVVIGCHYDTDLASYMYWVRPVEAMTVAFCIAEKHLQHKKRIMES